jgi:hypothetical protein
LQNILLLLKINHKFDLKGEIKNYNFKKRFKKKKETKSKKIKLKVLWARYAWQTHLNLGYACLIIILILLYSLLLI